MMKRMAGGFKRAAALVMSLFIILSQTALPVAALAQDVNALPSLNLYYPVGEGTQAVFVMPALYAGQPVYWATVPGDALHNGVTLEILPTGAEGETYNSLFGYQLMAQDASAVDGMMMATYIEVYQNEMLTGSYPLYISTRELPPEPPVLQPAAVRIECYDQNGNYLQGGEEWIDPAGGREISAPWIDGYTTSDPSVWVEMLSDGSLSQGTVTFTYQKNLQPAAVKVEGYDQNGQLIYSGEEWIDPAGGREISAPWIDGYTNSDPSVWVEMLSDGSLSQGTVTFTYQKNLQPAAVKVEGYDQNGQLIYSGEEWIDPAGGREISAPWIDGYTTSDPSVWVEMLSDGSLSQGTIAFYYSRVYSDAPITVNYYNQNGERIGGYEDTVGKDGKTIYPEMLEGYDAPTPESITVTMDDNGVLSQNTVDFYYTAAQPKTASITVKIVDSADWNTVFYMDTQDYTEGAYTFTPDQSYLWENYVLDSENPVTVNVYADGTADLYDIVFTATYHAPAEPEPEQPKYATITVKIVDSADWNNVFFAETKDYTEGAYTFTPDQSYLWENYVLDSENPVTVNVYADGTADLYDIVFTATYHTPAEPEPEQPKYATITVKIVDSADWNNVFFAETKDYAEGAYTFTPDQSYLWENYVLDSENPVTVNVYADGTADLYEVVFTATYHAPEQPEPEQPKTASITVKIVDSADWNTVFYTDTQDYTEGSYTFTPDQSYLWENYVLDSENPVAVNVYADGTADLYEVVFTATYHAPQQPEPEQPKAASITVKIVDSADWNTVFYMDTQDYTEGSYTFAPDQSYLWENYVLDSENPVTVNVYADGTADLYDIVFTATYHAPQQPEPEQPAEPKYASITMKIVDSANWENVFYNHTDWYGEGAHTFAPAAAYLPENYRLDNADPAVVNVNADGTADLYEIVFTATYHAPQQPEPEQPQEPEQPSNGLPEGATLLEELNCEGETTKGSLRFRSTPTTSTDGNIVFKGIAKGTLVHVRHSVQNAAGELWYGITHEGTECYVKGDCLKLVAKEPVSAKVTFLYQDAEGNTLLDSFEETFVEGAHATAPYFKEAPEGYSYQGVSHEQITVDANGANPSAVVFTYKVEEQQPVSAQVTIEYVCAGQPIADPVVKVLEAGSYPVSDYQMTIEGYILSSVNADIILVDANGANPSTVVFNYEAEVQQPVTAQVTLAYLCEGQPIADPVVKFFEAGSYPVSDYQLTVDGYTFTGASRELIVVEADGSTADFSVTYDYNRNPVYANVTIHHKLADGSDVPGLASETKTLEENTYSVQDFIQYAEGYSFQYASAESITVDVNGANPAEITLTYQKIDIKADITVHVQDTAGVKLADSTIVTLGEGAHAVSLIQPADPAGYAYSHASHEQITVTAGGADPAEVIFYYSRVPVQVMVHVRDTDGNPIADSYPVTLGDGTHDVSILKPADPAGYAYDHVSHPQVTISVNGADPAEITFFYRKLPTEAQVSFRYVDDQGNPVTGLGDYSATLAAGAYDTAVYAATAPNGYLYSGASAAQIVIDENGTSPAEVFFYYTKLPETVSVPVYHQGADGNQLLESTSLAFAMADFGKTFNTLDLLTIAAPEGYIYAGISSDTITIDQRGGVTPEAIQVTYVVRPKAEADVTFHYLCDGKNIAESQIHRLTEGTWDTNEYVVKVEGYDLIGADAQTVTIGMDGSASPAAVTFTYQKRITTAKLTVYYRNSFGEELTAAPEVRALEKGTHVITPNAAYVPAGYVLSANTQSFEVTVNNDLTISTPSVSFNYYDQNLTGTITVNYYDTESATTFATEEIKLAPGTHQIQPNEQLVKSKGNYEASDILTNTTVKVDEKGAVMPSAVVFYYKPATYQGYQGYMLTTQQTAIRKEAAAGGAVQALLDANTVLWSGFQYKSGATEWFDAQTQTGESFRGWVDGAHVRKISAEEAQILIEEANQPKEPDQNPGYYITIMNNVPLRQYKNTASQAKYLNINTVVQVSGQEYDDSGDYLWHAATYYDYTNKVKYSGFIRDGQLRKLTQEEVDEYLSANDPIDPEENTGNNQYDPNGASSYGYVTKDGVNFRSEPGGTRIKMLNKYGMALITGTREVNGVTWYNVNYSGQTGWIHGDYFHQMTLTEFTSFMGSEAYYQGITNNTVSSSGSSVSGGTKPNTGNTGSATQGNVSSVEDWNVGVWQNTGVTNTTTYQPFNPYATPVATTNPKGSYTVTSADVKFHQMASENSTAIILPKDAEITIAGTVTANGKNWYQVTYEGRNGYVDASAVLDKLGATPTPKPTSTFVIGTMIPITYDDQTTETQTGTVPWGLIGGAIVLVGGAGGVYAYALNQNKKRKAAAARAAAARRKAAAEAAAAGATSPYARRAVAAAPNSQQQRPVQPNAQNQYTHPVNAQQPVSTAQQQSSLYARPQQPAAPVQSAPAAQTQQTANPYARPAQPAPIVNPYAAPVQETKPASQQTANPYARPIAPISQQAASQSAENQPAAPRRSRMQRYHDANSDGGASTDA